MKAFDNKTRVDHLKAFDDIKAFNHIQAVKEKPEVYNCGYSSHSNQMQIDIQNILYGLNFLFTLCLNYEL